jgi:hypothetical protein
LPTNIRTSITNDATKTLHISMKSSLSLVSFPSAHHGSKLTGNRTARSRFNTPRVRPRARFRLPPVTSTQLAEAGDAVYRLASPAEAESPRSSGSSSAARTVALQRKQSRRVVVVGHLLAGRCTVGSPKAGDERAMKRFLRLSVCFVSVAFTLSSCPSASASSDVCGDAECRERAEADTRARWSSGRFESPEANFRVVQNIGKQVHFG